MTRGTPTPAGFDQARSLVRRGPLESRSLFAAAAPASPLTRTPSMFGNSPKSFGDIVGNLFAEGARSANDLLQIEREAGYRRAADRSAAEAGALQNEVASARSLVSRYKARALGLKHMLGLMADELKALDQNPRLERRWTLPDADMERALEITRVERTALREITNGRLELPPSDEEFYLSLIPYVREEVERSKRSQKSYAPKGLTPEALDRFVYLRLVEVEERGLSGNYAREKYKERLPLYEAVMRKVLDEEGQAFMQKYGWSLRKGDPTEKQAIARRNANTICKWFFEHRMTSNSALSTCTPQKI